MPVVIEQLFPLGRFHATRWNQSPFEDPYGEWPPSPWRLLRALAARWFQYIRENGERVEGPEGASANLARALPGGRDFSYSTTLIDGLLAKLARDLPDFVLPSAVWPGPAMRQYHPLDLGKKYEADYSYRAVGTTLTQDQYRAVPPSDPVLWVWKNLELTVAESDLLKQLLRRVVYFGRAESHCRFRVLDGEPPTPNCRLSATAGPGNPVLAATPGTDLSFESLLAITDSKTLKSRRIPAGTAWFHATVPPRPALKPIRPARRRHPADLCVLQFAVGGRVYPPPAHWVKLTERFRDRVIRERCRQLTGHPDARYGDLNAAQRDDLRLIRGIDGEGRRVDGDATPFFALNPDDQGLPTRLMCWRASPFTDDEIDALLAVAEVPFRWEYGNDDWQVRLVPLPFSVPRPAEYWNTGRVWKSVTPFVLPSGRRRTRGNGRPRTGETPDVCLRKLLVRFRFPEPEVQLISPEPLWVTIHETPDERGRRAGERGTRMRPGYRLRITFPQPVAGPLCVGHSCHFGLGLFNAE